MNLPVTVLIIAIFLSLSELGAPYLLAVSGGVAAGWVYWAYAVEHWIRWANRRGASAERIGRIGISGLLLWNVEHVKRVLGKGEG